ncbi:Tetraspanin-6 [Orchesella cincta]|uniref:Tetraspanin-6 n=1 Tax=Orchesella cincta TaxID=48709 RepID=A0A1D2MAE3_ORCCI|nr:Tetraspanin-6 [Orchesella cincta]
MKLRTRCKANIHLYDGELSGVPCFIAPFFLGILMIWGAFAAKNVPCHDGCTMVLELSALTMLFKNDADGMPENTMYNSMGNYYNEGSSSQNVSVQFWDYMQDNCCGIYGYTDWVAASHAPEVGFIPKSCCIGDNLTSASCTEVITKDKINSVAFIKNTIFYGSV